MTQTIKALRLYQWGRETTNGTAVAATSKIAVEEIDFTPDDKVDRPAIAKGLLHRNPGSESVVMRGTTFKVPETPAIYDQMQNWLEMALKGSVTPTGSNPYTWTYAVSLTADPAPRAFTLERRMTDGATPIDNEWSYCLISKLRWLYEINETLKFSAEGFARRVQASTLTAGQAMPTIEIPVTALAKCWIDSTWANLGVTQITAQVVRAEVTYDTGLRPKPTFDGRTDLDFTTYILDPSKRGLDVKLTLMAGAQYATEKTAAEALTSRAIRLQTLGTSSRELALDMLLKHKLGSSFALGDQDGQDTFTMDLEDTDDGTNMFQAKVVNAVSTLV